MFEVTKVSQPKVVKVSEIKVGDKLIEKDGYLLEVVAVNKTEITFKSNIRTFTQKFNKNRKLVILEQLNEN